MKQLMAAGLLFLCTVRGFGEEYRWGAGVMGGGSWRLQSGPLRSSYSVSGQAYYAPIPSIHFSAIYTEFFFPGSDLRPLLVSLGYHTLARWGGRPFFEVGIGSSLGPSSQATTNFSGDLTTRIAVGFDYPVSAHWEVGPVLALYHLSATGTNTASRDYVNLALAFRVNWFKRVDAIEGGPGD